jgi:hypothetical protein
MNAGIDKFLDHVDEWKFKLHARLSRMTAAQRKAFWAEVHERARARGLGVVEPAESANGKVHLVQISG